MVPGRHATPHGWGRGPRRAAVRPVAAPELQYTSPPAPPPPKRLLPVRCRDVLLRRSRGCRSCPVLASRYWSRVRRWRPARSSRMVPGRHATPHGWGRAAGAAGPASRPVAAPELQYTSAPAPPPPKRLLPVRCRDVLLRRSHGCSVGPVLSSHPEKRSRVRRWRPARPSRMVPGMGSARAGSGHRLAWRPSCRCVRWAPAAPAGLISRQPSWLAYTSKPTWPVSPSYDTNTPSASKGRHSVQTAGACSCTTCCAGAGCGSTPDSATSAPKAPVRRAGRPCRTVPLVPRATRTAHDADGTAEWHRWAWRKFGRPGKRGRTPRMTQAQGGRRLGAGPCCHSPVPAANRRRRRTVTPVLRTRRTGVQVAAAGQCH